MFWYLFLCLLLIFLFLSFNTRVCIELNALKIASEISVKILWFNVLKLKIKVKGKFIYINKIGIIYKEKLTTNNADIVFGYNFVIQMYFRIKLNEIFEAGQYGIKDDAFSTSLLCSFVDLVFKGILGKIKNNKKPAHIFITNSAIYNEDCLNLKFEFDFNVSIIDIIYSFVSSKLSSKGVKYERTRQRKQSEIAD